MARSEVADPVDSLPPALRCPVCRDALHFTPTETQPLRGGVFGVLTCSSHTYPVVDSIPVIRRGRVSVQDHMSGREEVVGPMVDELVEEIRNDRPLEALLRLLAFPPALPLGLEQLPVLRLPVTRGPGNRLGMALRRRHIRHWLRADLDRRTAQDWFDLSYLRTRNVNRELHPYFLKRFGQPRYLASLSLVSALPVTSKPVLDLACGFGHIMYHLDVRHERLDVVGMDRNFFQLWVARRWIAPRGTYVCADALAALPFEDDAFSTAMCTDSFHLFPEKAPCMAELRRCAENGTVLLDRVGNALLEPHEGSELPPQGYLDLIGETPYRMVSEKELIDGYLLGCGPQLATPRDLFELTKEKWLSLLVSDDPELFRDHGRFDRWPHGEGHLELNPIYRMEGRDDAVRLLFEFPSTWYAFENARMLSYHSAGVTLAREVIQEIRRGIQTPRTEELIEQFVLLAMPERYLRTVRE